MAQQNFFRVQLDLKKKNNNNNTVRTILFFIFNFIYFFHFCSFLFYFQFCDIPDNRNGYVIATQRRLRYDATDARFYESVRASSRSTFTAKWTRFYVARFLSGRSTTPPQSSSRWRPRRSSFVHSSVDYDSTKRRKRESRSSVVPEDNQESHRSISHAERYSARPDRRSEREQQIIQIPIASRS